MSEARRPRAPGPEGRIRGTGGAWAEAALAALAGITCAVLGPGEDGPGRAICGLCGAVLALLAGRDLRTGRIPNALVYPAGAATVLLAGAWPGLALGDVLAGAAAAGGPLAALRALSRGGLGGGDVKMGALVGALAGPERVVTAGLVAAVAGGVAAGALLAAGRAERRGRIPYGPFLALGGIAALLG